MLTRTIVAVLLGALAAVQVVRNGAVHALANSRPSIAADLWADHPAVELSLGMARIAEATRAKHAIPTTSFRMMDDAAPKEQLAIEPFLVKGVRAQLAGDGARAHRAFEAAQWRDKRSLPAAYFLAERYLQVGKVSEGLKQIAILARLSPGAAPALAPYLATFAADQRNWPALRKLFRTNPELANPALTAMARSAVTVAAALALADPRETDAPWLPPLLNTLTAASDYGRARAIWQRMSGVRTSGLLYDSTFSDKSSPPPFNWALTSSTVGLAERQAGGRLHVLFYGREDGFLATQLLLLPAGRYHLSMQLLGDKTRAHSLNWSIWCDRAEAPIASVALDAAAAQGWNFVVSADCPAQWLKLSGVSGDVPQEVEVTIGALRLEKAGRA